MKNTIKVILAIILILAAGGWVIYGYSQTRPGAIANNGVTGDPPEISEETRNAMREAGRKMERPKLDHPPDENEREQMRQEFEKGLTPEQRTEVEKAHAERKKNIETMKAALSPEDQELMRQKMRERFRGRGGRGRRGGEGRPPRGDGPPGSTPARPSDSAPAPAQPAAH